MIINLLARRTRKVSCTALGTNREAGGGSDHLANTFSQAINPCIGVANVPKGIVGLVWRGGVS